MKHLFSQFVAVLALAISVRAADQPPTLAIGSKAPDFTLPGVDDRNYSLKDFAASPNQKLFLLPMEVTGVLGSLAGIAELAKDSLGSKPMVAPKPPQMGS